MYLTTFSLKRILDIEAESYAELVLFQNHYQFDNDTCYVVTNLEADVWYCTYIIGWKIVLSQ